VDFVTQGVGGTGRAEVELVKNVPAVGREEELVDPCQKKSPAAGSESKKYGSHETLTKKIIQHKL
jgi:hypothetical protein